GIPQYAFATHSSHNSPFQGVIGMTALIRTAQFASLVLLAFALGCDTPKLPTGPQTAAPPVEPQQEEPPMVAGAPGKELPETEVPVTDIPRKFLASDPIQGRRS